MKTPAPRSTGRSAAASPPALDWKGLVVRVGGLLLVFAATVALMRVLPYSIHWRQPEVVRVAEPPETWVAGAGGTESPLNGVTISHPSADMSELTTPTPGCTSAAEELERHLASVPAEAEVVRGAAEASFAEAAWLREVEATGDVEFHLLVATCGLAERPDQIMDQTILSRPEVAAGGLGLAGEWKAGDAIPYRAEGVERIAAVPPRSCQPWSVALDRLPAGEASLAQHEAAMVRDGWRLSLVRDHETEPDTQLRIFERGGELALLTVYPDEGDTMLLTYLQTAGGG